MRQTTVAEPSVVQATGMFELRKSFTFEASHVLTEHDGKCARLHGHSYGLTIELRGRRLHRDGPKTNMLADFTDISQVVKAVLESHLDHHHLNDSLKTDSPTAEFIARWVYKTLVGALPLLSAVEVRETASSCAIYRPPRRRPNVLANGHIVASDLDDDDDDPDADDDYAGDPKSDDTNNDL